MGVLLLRERERGGKVKKREGKKEKRGEVNPTRTKIQATILTQNVNLHRVSQWYKIPYDQKFINKFGSQPKSNLCYWAVSSPSAKCHHNPLTIFELPRTNGQTPKCNIFLLVKLYMYVHEHYDTVIMRVGIDSEFIKTNATDFDVFDYMCCCTPRSTKAVSWSSSSSYNTVTSCNCKTTRRVSQTG